MDELDAAVVLAESLTNWRWRADRHGSADCCLALLMRTTSLCRLGGLATMTSFVIFELLGDDSVKAWQVESTAVVGCYSAPNLVLDVVGPSVEGLVLVAPCLCKNVLVRDELMRLQAQRPL